jgi:hypothetical protein
MQTTKTATPLSTVTNNHVRRVAQLNMCMINTRAQTDAQVAFLTERASVVFGSVPRRDGAILVTGEATASVNVPSHVE